MTTATAKSTTTALVYLIKPVVARCASICKPTTIIAVLAAKSAASAQVAKQAPANPLFRRHAQAMRIAPLVKSAQTANANLTSLHAQATRIAPLVKSAQTANASLTSPHAQAMRIAPLVKSVQTANVSETKSISCLSSTTLVL